MREEKLEQIKSAISLMKEIIDEDLAVSVWDVEGTMLYFNKAKTFPLHFEEGFQILDKNDPLFEAMRTRKVVHTVVPKERFGVNIEGNLVPVYDEGQVVGCIAGMYSLEKYSELEDENNKIKNTLLESKDSINEILNAAINTTENLKSANESMENLDKSISGIFNVVDSIKDNTSRTRMLSLNASIEAARAGDSGQGFKIVANEMGKLSQMSSESVNNINQTLNEMMKSIEDVKNSINQINKESFNNSGVVKKIISVLERI